MADALGWCLIVLGTIAVLLAEYAVAVAIFSWLNRLVVEPWRVRAAQDETWAGAVTFVRDMAKAISGVTPHSTRPSPTTPSTTTTESSRRAPCRITQATTSSV